MASILETTTFGAISAEDDDLKKYFVRTPVFEEILSRNKQIIIGRKGAGKTALYLAVLDKAEELKYFATGLTFQDYPWAHHYKYQSSVGDSYERFVHSWKFLVYLEIFKILLTEDKRKTRYDASQEKALKEVEAFIQKNWGLIAFDYKKTFPQAGFNISELDINPQAAGFGLGGLKVDLSKQTGLGDTVSRLNDWLWYVLKSVGSNAPDIFILFDELDSGFNPAIVEYVDRVTGLLLAMRSLRRDFSKSFMPFSAVAVLRTDIFDHLHFGDKNKLVEANVTFLSWQIELKYVPGAECSLKELIDRRIQEALQLDGIVPSPWEFAFDDKQMRGTLHKFHHMAYRTYLRPRDIIKFCNCALSEAKSRITRTKAPMPYRITNDDIAASRKNYSAYLLKELDDEIAPVMANWKSYLEILKRIGFTKFSREQFKENYEQLAGPLSYQYSQDAALEMLYRYSVIGFERAPGGSGITHQFRYTDELIIFDGQARSFMVHRGLKEALELADIGEPKED